LGTGKAADARSMFEALTHEPDLRARALAGEGLALLVLNKEDDAERRLQQAVSADPSLWRAYNGLGLVADMRRDPEKASAAYFAALALQPASAVILNNLGYSRLLAGRADEALNYLKRALTLDPSSETIQNNVRLALAAGGNYPEATRSVSRALTPVVLNNVGYIALQRGDLVDAEGYLAAAMESSTSFNSIAAKNLEQLRTLKRAAR
jgi:Flp pilus assembly protein TadD